MEIDEIRAALKKSGKTKKGLAEALGRRPSAITALLKGDRQLKATEIPIVENYLGLAAELEREAEAALRTRLRSAEPDLKIYAAAEGGPGQMVVSADPIDIIPRPSYLGSVRDGFGVRVVGESMQPAFAPGDIAIINPRLPFARDRDVILVSEETAGGFTAAIKHLVRWTEKDWHLLQFNPPPGQKREFILPRKVWPRALLVVGRHYGG